ncbi:MAG: TonB-dependent receptor [Nitrospinae bacterium]|nr:TonB-dependent receptor [Nitrospinota bacterium]
MKRLSFLFFVVLFLNFALLTTCLTTIAFAQESVETLPEIVVTATRIEETPKEVTQDITVITKDDIEKKGVEFITDVFRSVPELNLVQNGGAGKNATLFLRGGSPNQTVMMIDGVKVKSPTTGSLDLAGIITDDIERIEVIKGPQSTLYGSEAMAGVINIITKKGRGKPKLSISAEGGSFSTYKTTASISGAMDVWDYRVTASYFDTGGISAAKNGTEADGYTNKSISTKIGLMPSDKLGVELNLRYFEDTSKLDSYKWGVGLVDDLNYVQEGKHYLISAKGMFSILDSYEQTLTLSSIGDNLKFEDPDTSSNRASIDTTMQTADWQHNLYISDTTFTGGIEYRKEAGEIRDNFNKEVDNKAFYLNGKIKLFDDSFIFNAGLRNDEHKTAGIKTTYRTGGLYDFKPYGLKLKGNYGTGFRSPTLNELYYPFFGNTNLKPEKSEGYDMGIEKDLYGDRLLLNATYFNQQYHDLIEYDFATFTAQNIGKAEIKGIELGLTAGITEDVNLKASHTNMDTVDKDSNKPLTRRPTNKFNSSIEYKGGKFIVIGEYTYVSERYDSAVSRNLSQYSLVNLKGRYFITDSLTIFARVDNLFNENYEEAGGYGTPGVSAFGGVKAEF